MHQPDAFGGGGAGSCGGNGSGGGVGRRGISGVASSWSFIFDGRFQCRLSLF